MTKKKKKKKQVDKQIERFYSRHAAGRQINVMDIGKVFAMGHGAIARGEDLEGAIKAAIELYCHDTAK